jgi:hypothetical protein
VLHGTASPWAASLKHIFDQATCLFWRDAEKQPPKSVKILKKPRDGLLVHFLLFRTISAPPTDKQGLMSEKQESTKKTTVSYVRNVFKIFVSRNRISQRQLNRGKKRERRMFCQKNNVILKRRQGQKINAPSKYVQ